MTKYIAREEGARSKSQVTIPRNTIEKLPIGEQLKAVAKLLKLACPQIFRRFDPYPTLRMTTFNKEKITYEITEGCRSKTKACGL